MIKRLLNDIRVVMERDPAARNSFEVFLIYPGVHALCLYRISHWLWNYHLKTLARLLSNITRFWTGIEIHPAARLGKGLFIDHGMGVVIGETAEVKDNVTLYHGVTIGGTSLHQGKRHPTIEDDVIIGAGAKVLGNINIGKGCHIGANAVVLKSTPPNSIVVGVPGQIILRSQTKSEKLAFDTPYPDTVGISLSSVLKRLEKLEAKENGNKEKVIQIPDNGVWHGEDFMI